MLLLSSSKHRNVILRKHRPKILVGISLSKFEALQATRSWQTPKQTFLKQLLLKSQCDGNSLHNVVYGVKENNI